MYSIVYSFRPVNQAQERCNQTKYEIDIPIVLRNIISKHIHGIPNTLKVWKSQCVSALPSAIDIYVIGQECGEIIRDLPL